MKTTDVSRAALGRIPVYLKFIESLPQDVETVSATTIAKALGFGEVQVRKDLGAICGSGKPRIGYTVSDLKKCLGGLIDSRNGKTVIVGAGKLGRALLDYGGFSDYGLDILAAFDTDVSQNNASGKPILPIDGLHDFCKENDVSIGVITVPAKAAQEVCDKLCQSGIKAIMSFAPCKLTAPEGVAIQYENMALSLAHLKTQIEQ
ncbi:MAG: redox-sensing transcriptional repressor Rex [Oscillospiraceae bacterium]|nr:redox-sensing transcriptional repressor Rex [Oscillospiraceae bacterium]MDY4623726.1 redox-sensing transcriptional repressor Rex [Oscillospiraceae bacterium]